MTEEQKLVQQELELEECGTEAQVKVCFLHGAHRNTSLFHSYSCLQLGTRLIALLLHSPFLQPPADQTPDISKYSHSCATAACNRKQVGHALSLQLCCTLCGCTSMYIITLCLLRHVFVDV